MFGKPPFRLISAVNVPLLQYLTRRPNHSWNVWLPLALPVQTLFSLMMLLRQKIFLLKELPAFGLQSGDGAQGKVPFLLAEYLGIRCISNVTGISPAGDGSLSVISQRDAEICTETVHGPALLIIGNIANTFLRVPTLRQRMQSRGQKITLYHEAELASSFPEELNPATTVTVRLTNIEPVLQQRDSEIFEETDASKASGVLFDYYKKWI